MVVPVTLPVIFSLSDAPTPGRKFALRVMAPPPSKLPVTVSASSVSVSLPASSVPPAATPTFAEMPCVPLPKSICEPAPMLIVSQPVTVELVSVADTSLSVRVLALLLPPAVSVPMFAMSMPSSVRLSELSFSLISPLIVAPLSTMTLSQPFRPSLMTVACRLPSPLLNFSVSPSPSPPSISVTFENVPPANVSVSAPPPRLTLPAIVAPVFTVTVVLAAPPMIALAVPAVVVPTDAPLLSRMVAPPVETSVLIAALLAPVPPVTAVVTVMVVAPLPS